jgi:hypothetical protein
MEAVPGCTVTWTSTRNGPVLHSPVFLPFFSLRVASARSRSIAQADGACGRSPKSQTACCEPLYAMGSLPFPCRCFRTTRCTSPPCSSETRRSETSNRNFLRQVEALQVHCDEYFKSSQAQAPQGTHGSEHVQEVRGVGLYEDPNTPGYDGKS